MFTPDTISGGHPKREPSMLSLVGNYVSLIIYVKHEIDLKIRSDQMSYRSYKSW